MRRDAESAETVDVLDDVARVAGERIRRRRHADRDVVTLVRADLHAIEAEHAGPVDRRIGNARRVTVIGEDDELESRLRRGGRDLVRPAQTVGSIGMDVEDARDGAVADRRKLQAPRRDREEDEHSNGGRDDRRCLEDPNRARPAG